MLSDSETGCRILKLLRCIQKLLLVFRNCQKLLWCMQKPLHRIQKLPVGFRIFRVSLRFNSFRVGVGFLQCLSRLVESFFSVG